MSFITTTGQALLGNLDSWQIRELPKEKWGIFGTLERQESIQAVFISGDAYGTTKKFEGFPSVAAMDVVVKEEKRQPGEPPTNIYHYTFQKEDGGQIVQRGPSRDETILGHWPLGMSTTDVIRNYRKLSDGLI